MFTIQQRPTLFQPIERCWLWMIVHENHWKHRQGFITVSSYQVFVSFHRLLSDANGHLTWEPGGFQDAFRRRLHALTVSCATKLIDNMPNYYTSIHNASKSKLDYIH
jgi:hypothetical protein